MYLCIICIIYSLLNQMNERYRENTRAQKMSRPFCFSRRCLGRKSVCLLMSCWQMLAIAVTCIWLAVQVKRPSRKWPSVSKTPRGSSCMTSLWGEFVDFVECWVKPSSCASDPTLGCLRTPPPPKAAADSLVLENFERECMPVWLRMLHDIVSELLPNEMQQARL